MRQAMLTTIDNPFDPFTEFENWFQFDLEHGYNTCSYLARIAGTSSELSEKDNLIEIERAIDEICEINDIGLYKKVVRDQ